MGVARLMVLAAVLGFGWGLPAAAGSFERCGRSEVKLAQAAIAGAAEVAARAGAAVRDTPGYARWFGAWSPAHGETVRRNLKAVHKALGADGVTAVCLGPAEIDCKGGTFAFVVFDRPMTVHLCPSFFAMPSMRDALAGVGDQANGTREGTIIHELSHFPELAETGDGCYSRDLCAEMAAWDPGAAIATADSYQYFAEDVTVAQTAKDDRAAPLAAPLAP